MREKGILVIAGPSAGGKTTLAHELLREGDFELSRSVTTRQPRGDSYDAEYIYVSREEFLKLRDGGMLLEWAEYSGDLYGTPRSEPDRILAAGRAPLLILNLDGVRAISDSEYDTCAVYVYCDPNVAEQRLYDRYIADNPTVEGLSGFVRRKEQNLSDYKALPEMSSLFYATVFNEGSVEEGARALKAAFDSFASGAERSADEVENAFAALADFSYRKSGNGG